MFKCQSCNRTTEPREPQHKMVVEKREKIYNNGGHGWEIVKEIAICSKCLPNKLP